MTVIFEDIHEEDKPNMAQNRVPGTTEDEILFADDTICISESIEALQRLLHAIEIESKKYGLQLNKGKCEIISYGEDKTLKCTTGETIKKKG